MLNITLFEPEIPPNTGNIIRLASNCGARLHLIRPLGFALDDRKLRRAGLDYHEFSQLQVYENWEDFLNRTETSKRLFACSTRGTGRYSDFAYQNGDYFVFGPETRGLPEEILQSEALQASVRLPMLPHSRSLNLSNAAAIIVYEAWRQLGFPGAATG